MDKAVLSTPAGLLEICGDAKGLSSARFLSRGVPSRSIPASLRSAASQLRRYFNDARTEFRISLHPETGSVFQRAVWRALCKVNSGSVVTYGDLAAAVGRPRAARAVGTAMRKNPMCIVVPCHRVLPASSKENPSKPGNYAGGAKRKIWLLSHELQPSKG